MPSASDAQHSGSFMQSVHNRSLLSDATEPEVVRPIGFLAAIRQGIGLTTDLYDLTIINVVRPDFEQTYGKLTVWENGVLTAASHAGAVMGQLLFGRIADVFGRRGAFICTSVIMFVSALGAASTAPMGSISAARVMIFWRFMLGVGIGGEYPLSASVTAEGATARSSYMHMATLCMCFWSGQLLAPVVVLTCLYSGVPSESTWRIGFGCGSGFALLGATIRYTTMVESQAWREAQNDTGGGIQHAGMGLAATVRAVGRPLAGTVIAWFLYDIVGYGTGSYTTSLFQSKTREESVWMVLFFLLLSSPGYLLTFCVSRFGRRCFQLTGFVVMGLIFAAMGILSHRTVQGVEVLLFGIQKTFDAFGPGAMTFMIPAEIFPTRIRASCHGISAAAGKLGAVVGTLLLPPLETQGLPAVMYTCCGLCFLGSCTTLFLTPPYDASTLQAMRDGTKSDISRTTTILWNQ